MPELPEVETTRTGIAPHLLGRRIERLAIRQPSLRWPIPRTLIRKLPGQSIGAIERRAKYLLVHTDAGSAVLHLGMTGSLRVLDQSAAPGKHDHYDCLLDSGKLLRFTDPRRPFEFARARDERVCWLLDSHPATAAMLVRTAQIRAEKSLSPKIK